MNSGKGVIVRQPPGARQRTRISIAHRVRRDPGHDVGDLTGPSPIREVVARHLDDVGGAGTEERAQLATHLALGTGNERRWDGPPCRVRRVEHRRGDPLTTATGRELLGIILGPAASAEVRRQFVCVELESLVVRAHARGERFGEVDVGHREHRVADVEHEGVEVHETPD
jgi:hypothetical protein